LQFIPLKVFHGAPYVCLGYRFGNITYISDCSEIPDETRALLKGTELLIIDSLRPEKPHKSHLTMEQAIEEIRKIGPTKSLLTGLSHYHNHERDNKLLATMTDIDVQLAYDGQRILIPLPIDNDVKSI